MKGRPSRKGVAIRADFDAAIFDLDGVVTQTARVHAAAWKRVFDEFLRRRAAAEGAAFRPFDIATDYLRYVDGKPRYDGVAGFLDSRGIRLPHGDVSDPPDRETVCGLGNRKNRAFQESLETSGVPVFDTTVAFVRALRRRGIKTALVSSSRNARKVLAIAGLADLFDVCIDGEDVLRLGLRGKPAPDLFLLAAQRLAIAPDRAIVVEDALSGVAAGRAGGFARVVGVDRKGRAADLRQNGANIVVQDLADLHIQPRGGARRRADSLPRALDTFGEIERALRGKRAAVFLDYDGTLTPIVARPELAVLTDEMRTAIGRLAAAAPVAVISGRDRADVARLVGLPGLIYAGSHGFDIAGPASLQIRHTQGLAFAGAVQRAAERLRAAIAPIAGALVEPKAFAVAVHYRQVPAKMVPAVEAAVDGVLGEVPELHKTLGKKVFELRPRLDWDKGKALLWLLDAMKLDGDDVLPFYLGDDVTDEDAFAAIAGRGIGILVGYPAWKTAARYVLDGPEQVRHFLERLADILGRRDG
mgnify:CR=1 FL=1